VELLQASAGTPGPPNDAEMGVSRPGQAIHLSTGFDVNYVAQGDHLGVPVLLLHAWGESLGCFDRLMPLLRTTIRVLAMDQHGHGHSDNPADAHSLSDVAGDVTAFLDAMGLADAVLVGSSSGGIWQQTLSGLIEAIPPTEVGTIRTPTLIIWGERDDVLPRTDGTALAAAIPGSRLVVYPDTGHLVLWEQPARLASDVTAFVRNLNHQAADA
jgi:pimeloyl-ACP methyl ester carboxylesterase